MKRTIAICICLILVLTASIGFCDDSSGTSFECPLTAALVPESTIEVLTSDVQRALLTICLIVDLTSADEKEARDFLSEHSGHYIMNGTYVVSDGSMLIVSGYAEGKVLNMFYDPKGKEAMYTLTDSDLPDALTATVIKQTAETQTFSYKNDTATVLKVLEVIKDAVSGN